jgi:hypothetical protein
MRACAAVLIFIAALSATACDAREPMNDAKMAILLAGRACADSWGNAEKRQGSKWRVDPKSWHARRKGDHWVVWSGDRKKPVLNINIPLRGRQIDSGSCSLQFQD